MLLALLSPCLRGPFAAVLGVIHLVLGDCRISELDGLLQHREQVLAIVESEADEIAAKFGSPRCTVMSAEASSSMSVEDIIPNSQSLVVFSRKGYIKRIPSDTFAVQHRGGRGDPPLSAPPPSSRFPLPPPFFASSQTALGWLRALPLQHTCFTTLCPCFALLCLLLWSKSD